MKGRLRDWCDEAWAAVQETPGGVGAELRARWEAHASRDHVVVTFFGPYDSGKSSLLKRLLVDDGKPVPDWLTVSGRRETFEPKEVSVAGLVVRDTPGIAGGNELHEAIAKEALLLTDAIALVLPPQLVTSDRESLVAVFNGRRFRCAARLAFAAVHFLHLRFLDPAVEDVPAQHQPGLQIVGLAAEAVDIVADPGIALQRHGR